MLALRNAQCSFTLRGRRGTTVSWVVWCTVFFFSSRRRHTRSDRDWSSDVCSSDLGVGTCFFGRDRLDDPVTGADEVVLQAEVAQERQKHVPTPRAPLTMKH